MAQVNNLSQGNLSDIFRRLRALEFSTNQNHMSISRGNLTVMDGGSINIENGGLNVTGSATISGTLVASGDIDMAGSFTATGDVNLNGPTAIAGVTTVTGQFTVTGPTALNGTTTVAGDTTVTGVLAVNGAMKTTSTLSVEGVTTLKNDLNVTTGKVKAGGMTIDPGLFGGSVQFSAGGYLSGTASGPQITGPAGNSFVFTRSGKAGLQAAAIDLIGAVEVQGALKVTSPGTVTGVTPNVYMDSAGNLRKIN
ncbi:hypothetical protein LRQ04_00170 [Paenarthrobacter sp. AR 02]|uniref:hypothetical protein n=1 Tax=Paenarthrobacter sp. AR 02 TaxID=2899821 RepID=UPI001F4219F0|nr:hypothetical protein [Paenarthrobacter sp. AR 02]MCF3137657.1 hypothetical protein [Paenarthrobacter sp. AR 02]